MSGCKSLLTIEERTRRIEEAVKEGHINPDLGTALLNSTLIHSQLHHAGNYIAVGNISEAIQNYEEAVHKLRSLRDYVEKASLTPEQREAIIINLTDSFSSIYSSLSQHPSYTSEKDGERQA